MLTTFDQKSLHKLLSKNGIKHIGDISLSVAPNLDGVTVTIPNDSSEKLIVPSFFLNADDYMQKDEEGKSIYKINFNIFFSLIAGYVDQQVLSREDREVFQTILDIQNNASQDPKFSGEKNFNEVFRKLTFALYQLTILKQNSKKYSLKTQALLGYLIGEAKQKVTKILIIYKTCNEKGSNCRYIRTPLINLLGGKELIESAILETMDFDVFSFISENAQNKENLDEDELVPIALFIGSSSMYTIEQMDSMKQSCRSNGLNLCFCRTMNKALGTLNKYRNFNRLDMIKKVFISSIPPYFENPNFDEFSIMKKYDVFNYERSNIPSIYSINYILHVRGILRIFDGEYSELCPMIIVSSEESIVNYADINWVSKVPFKELPKVLKKIKVN